MAAEGAKKRGPRTHQEKMAHHLMMTAEIAAVCPPLADLIESIAQNAIDADEIEPQLTIIRAALEKGPVNIGADKRGTDTIDCVARSAERFSHAAARMAAINQANAALHSARRTTHADKQAQWEELKATVLQAAAPIAPPVIEVARELVAAGVTGKQVRDPVVRDRVRRALTGFIGTPSIASRPVALPPVPRPLPDLQAKWQALPNPVPGYKFLERDFRETGVGPRDLAFYLPPFTSLDEIAPGTGLQLQGLASSRDRYTLALKAMRSWAKTNRYSQPQGDDTAQMRAWCFLIGYVHDFLDGIAELDKVTLVSPWSNRALVVRRG